MKNHKSLKSGVILLYAAFMLMAFPLLYHDNYIDIQTFKSRLFVTASATALAAIMLLDLWQAARSMGRREQRPGPHRSGRGLALQKKALFFPVCMLALFSVTVLISWYASAWRQMAWDGSMGRRMGAAAFLLCILLWMETIRIFRPHPVLLWGTVFANLSVCLVIILHFWGADPSGMYANLVPDQHAFFLGTIGNRNVTAGYLSLIVPAAMALYLHCVHRKQTVVLAVLIAFGIYGGLAASSDSFLLGCFGGYLALLWMALSNPARLKRCCHLLLIGYLSLVCMKLSLVIGHAAGCRAPFLTAYPDDGLLGIILQTKWLIFTGGCVAAMLVLVRCLSDGRPQAQETALAHTCLVIRNALFFLILVAMLLLILFVLLANLFDENTCPPILQHFLLPYTFGSGRGYIWRRSLAAFRQMPVREKLIGCGPDCFYLYMAPQYAQEMTMLFGAPFADAHSEFLQLLLTTGLLGVISYFGFLLSLPAILLREAGSKPHAAVACAVIPAYLFQGAVNSPQIAVTPVFFMMVGLCAGLYLPSKQEVAACKG